MDHEILFRGHHLDFFLEKRRAASQHPKACTTHSWNTMHIPRLLLLLLFWEHSRPCFKGNKSHFGAKREFVQDDFFSRILRGCHLIWRLLKKMTTYENRKGCTWPRDPT